MSRAAPGRLGLVALGDSITVAEGDMLDDVTCRSWALWLAEALDLPFTAYARNGIGAAQLRAELLPRVRADYDLGCLYVGVNDVRSPAWDRDAFARELPGIVAGLDTRADALLLCTIPLDLGRPRAGARKVEQANAIIRGEAAARDAVVCELDDFAGPEHLTDDAVHPTALGQREIARRAQRALAASGILEA